MESDFPHFKQEFRLLSADHDVGINGNTGMVP